jgi:hypothetical protein
VNWDGGVEDVDDDGTAGAEHGACACDDGLNSEPVTMISFRLNASEKRPNLNPGSRSSASASSAAPEPSTRRTRARTRC